MADILLVRPSYDYSTKVAHSWADEVRAAIESSESHVCNDLSGVAATRTNVEAELQQPIDCMVFYGHGSEGSLSPQDGLSSGPAILDTSNHLHQLNKKIVCAVACYSSKVLGPRVVNKEGVAAYIGYRECFWLVAGGTLGDWFRRAANAVILHLIDTSEADPSCDAAIAHARGVYDDAYNHCKRGDGANNANQPFALAYLLWNRDSLTLSGDGNSKLP